MDALLDYLYAPTSVGLLNMELLLYIVAGLLVLIALVAAFATFQSNKASTDDENYKFVECASCGWSGQVSKYVRVCPKCNDSNFISKN